MIAKRCYYTFNVLANMVVVHVPSSYVLNCIICWCVNSCHMDSLMGILLVNIRPVTWHRIKMSVELLMHTKDFHMTLPSMWA